jgi:hypothetical protein
MATDVETNPEHLTPEEAAAVVAVVDQAVARRTRQVDLLRAAVRHFRLVALARGATEREIAAGDRLLTNADRAVAGLPPLPPPDPARPRLAEADLAGIWKPGHPGAR